MNINTQFTKPKFMFKGMELEGPLSGTPTLFVSDKVPANIIIEHLEKEQLSHVYFGANHLSRVDLETVFEVYKSHTGYITVEIADWKEFLLCASNHLDLLQDLFSSPSFYLMCCVYKAPHKKVFENNVTSLDYLLADAPCLGIQNKNILIKIESLTGVYVTQADSFSTTTWDQYANDMTIWEETVNT